MARNKNNNCGIATYALYPIVAMTTTIAPVSTRVVVTTPLVITTASKSVLTRMTTTTSKASTTSTKPVTPKVNTAAATATPTTTTTTTTTTTASTTITTTTVAITTTVGRDWSSNSCYFSNNTIFTFGIQLTTSQCAAVCINSITCTHYTVDSYNNYCWLQKGFVTPQNAIRTTNYYYVCGIISQNTKIQSQRLGLQLG